METAGKTEPSLNHLNLIVEIEDGVLAELGELCHEPTADGSIARGQREAAAVFQEKIGLHIIFAVGKAIDEALHILVFEVLKLITVKGFARALGNILSGGSVSAVNNLHLGEILSDLRDRLILGGGGVIHLFGEVCGNGDGAGGKINLVAAGRKILCKRFSTKVKNGAGKQGEFWPESLDYRKPWRSERYARRHGVNAGLTAVAY